MPTPHLTTRRTGSSLISAVVSLGLTALCFTLMLHAALQGERLSRSQRCRTEAFAACQARLETLLAGGYASLPAPGRQAFAVISDFSARGEIVITPGPVAGTRGVTARVVWPRSGEETGGQVELATIMAARGGTP